MLSRIEGAEVAQCLLDGGIEPRVRDSHHFNLEMDFGHISETHIRELKIWVLRGLTF